LGREVFVGTACAEAKTENNTPKERSIRMMNRKRRL
jgi:hypothetical protein